MRTTSFWLKHFQRNLQKQRIHWDTDPVLTDAERKTIVKSMQAWQLGETSDGRRLKAATLMYACRINDPMLPSVMDLFIKEEQKHGENLGKYLDRIGEKRIQSNWGDSLFRLTRNFNLSMEVWTLTVITVESTAQVYYQALKDATGCPLLKQVCTDILIDESHHIQYQFERLAEIIQSKGKFSKFWRYFFYRFFFYSIVTIVWMAHRKLFRAGRNDLQRYYRKMNIKFNKTLKRLIRPKTSVYKSSLKWEQIKL